MAVSKSDERIAFLDQWYQREKSAERMGAIALMFATGLVMAFDSTGDEFTVLAIATMLSGAITLFLNSRRGRAVRTHLRFMQADVQSKRATYAGMGAIILLWQFNERPLAWIVAGLLVIVSFWLQWRAKQIQRFDALFQQSSEASDDTIEA